MSIRVARVMSVGGSRASVTFDGVTIVRGVYVDSGAVSVGDVVSINTVDGKMHIVTAAPETETSAGSTMYVGGSTTIINEGGGTPLYDKPMLIHYAATPDRYDTIQAALNAASNGETVLVPVGTYNGSISVPANTTLRGVSMQNTIIEGQVTLNAGSLLENLTVHRTANSSSTIYGIVIAGDSNMGNVIVSVTNNGSGIGKAVYTDNGMVVAKNCDFSGSDSL